MATIWVSKGEIEYVGGTITNNEGEDISGIDYGIGLSHSHTEPPDEADFGTPDVNVEGSSTAVRTLKKLIDDSVELGTWYCWASIPDTPEKPYVLLSGPHYVK